MVMVPEGHLTGSSRAALAAASQEAVQAAAAPQSGDPVHDLQESAPEAGVHVAVDHRIVAAVRHGQPVEGKPHVRQRDPVGELLVVEQELW